jgi:hypothetical protein
MKKNYTKEISFPFYRSIFYLLLAFLLLIFIAAESSGQNWEALGLGTNNDVRAMTVYNGELIIAGEFTSTGGISANRVANGSIQWRAYSCRRFYPGRRSRSKQDSKMEREQLAAYGFELIGK